MRNQRDKGVRYEPNRWQYIENVARLKKSSQINVESLHTIDSQVR